jgi:hypothetical protein
MSARSSLRIQQKKVFLINSETLECSKINSSESSCARSVVLHARNSRCRRIPHLTAGDIDALREPPVPVSSETPALGNY